MAAALWLTVAGCATSAAEDPVDVSPGTAASASLRDGAYARDQAERGAAAYAEACSSCHAADLRGNSNAPSLVGASFLFLWEDRTLAELFTVIRTEMPTNAPNSLSEATYLDILAHVLAANGFPSGERQLTADAEHLSEIRIAGNDP